MASARPLPKYAQKVLALAANDAQLQALMPDEAVAEALQQPGQTFEQVIETALAGYGPRPAFGERAYEVAIDSETGRKVRRLLPRFDTVSYFELRSRIHNLASRWRHDPQHRVEPNDFVCILGFSGIDYAVVDLACAYAQAVSVPLQSTLAGFDLDGIFTDTAPVAVAATSTDLALAARLAGTHPSIRSVIAFDYDERIDDDREQFAAAQTELAQNRSKARLITLAELINFGDFESWRPLPSHPDGVERMAVIMHSSGSTGTPKGAILSDRLVSDMWDPNPKVPVVRVGFAPMNHLTGRNMVYPVLARGGTALFTAKDDLTTLFEDMRIARPTESVFFPRVLEMIHHHFQGEVMRRRKASGADLETVRAEVMADMRENFLGDRIAMMTVGAAPTTPEIQKFMRDCFNVTFAEGYGSTEAGTTVTMRDRIVRSVVIDYKLRDVPELGYYTTDKPYPRGELCVKTRLSVPGYFKRPEATAKLFDEEGYVLTGDIMEERGPDHVVYIDRRNDVLKLSQGEYVAIGNLGTIYENGSAAIMQMYAYGNSARAYLLAVIVPDMEVVRTRLGKEPDDAVGSSRVDLQACKLEYSIVSPK